MVVSIVLLVLVILFIALDMALGCWRGLLSALTRLFIVIGCAVGAYFLAPVVSHWLLDLPIVDGQSIQMIYEGFLGSYEQVVSALELSEGIKTLVYHLPEVLVNEIMFVLLFFVLRLVTIPVSFLISVIVHIFKGVFLKIMKKGSKKPNKEGKKSRGKRAGYATLKTASVLLRFGGAIPGALQAIVCVLVLLVPLFGMVEFGERFSASFSDSNHTEIVAMADAVEDEFVEPVNNSFVGKICGAFGIKKACITVFHHLSDTEVEVSGKTMKIDYFEFMESLFEPINSLLKLQNVDPEHMTEDDYDNLSSVIATAQTSEHKEYITEAVKGGVTEVVSQHVDDSFRNSADIVVNNFTDKILESGTPITSAALQSEVNAVRDTLTVIQTATSENVESAFEVIKADTLVNSIIETEYLYETLTEVTEDPEQLEVIRTDFTMDDEQKETMKAEIEKYRNESLATRSEEEMAKIVEITDTLAKVFDLQLADPELLPVQP